MLVDSANLEVNLLNALIYYNMDNYEDATQAFERCQLLGDSSLTVNRGLGISYYFLEKDSNAIEYLKKAYVQDTTNNTVLYALASTYHNLAFYRESVDCYQLLLERTIPKRNTLYTYYNGMAQSYEKNHQFEEAIQNCRRTVWL